jgi:hypothetical protein
VSTMVLSEARGLWLFLVVRGGIWFIQRLAVLEAHSPTERTYGYSPSNQSAGRTDYSNSPDRLYLVLSTFACGSSGSTAGAVTTPMLSHSMISDVRDERRSGIPAKPSLSSYRPPKPALLFRNCRFLKRETASRRKRSTIAQFSSV